MSPPVCPAEPVSLSDYVAAAASSDDFEAGPYRTLEDALDMAPEDLKLVANSRFQIAERRAYFPEIDLDHLFEQVASDTILACGQDVAFSFLSDVSPSERIALKHALQGPFVKWLKASHHWRDFWELLTPRMAIYMSRDEGSHFEDDPF